MLKVVLENGVVSVFDTEDNQMQLDINDILQLIPLLTKIVEKKFTTHNKQNVPCNVCGQPIPIIKGNFVVNKIIE